MEAIAEPVTALSAYELDRNKPMPSLNHSIVQSNINFGLQLHYRDQYRIVSELKLAMPDGPPDTVPDLCIYPLLAFDPLQDKVKMKQMPLCAIEILSASQSDEELTEKISRYFSVGIKSCWLVIPLLKLVSVFSDAHTQQTFLTGIAHDAVLGIDLDLVQVFR
jgi:Uma2 family endonuclease